MDIYKNASKQKLRFKTSKGNLSTEQLWDLSLNELDALAVSLEEETDKTAKKSFLTETSTKNQTAKLRFDIVLDVLETKVKARDTALKAAETKARNQKIMSLIQDKEDESLKEKSVDELKKMLEA